MVYGSGVDLEPEKNDSDSINVVRINVGGVHYETLLSTLQSEESMLSSMFSGNYKVERDKDGCVFIDRPGENFGYILNYLRDNSLVPSNKIAMQVYTEASYYQIQSLIKQLERTPEVFRNRLKKATAEKYTQFLTLKQKLITQAQRKSEDELTPQARVHFITASDKKKLEEPPECVFNEHIMSVTAGESNRKETFDQIKRRLDLADIVVNDNGPNFDMAVIVNKLEKELQNEGYNCTIWVGKLQCLFKNNYTRKECNFNMKEYIAEFKWE